MPVEFADDDDDSAAISNVWYDEAVADPATARLLL